METGIHTEAECPTFREHIDGNLLDKFTPKPQSRKRVHNSKVESRERKPSTSIFQPYSRVMQRAMVKEEENVSEAVGLMTERVENTLTKREHHITDLRMHEEGPRLVEE
jgi:hypothetical protein